MIRSLQDLTEVNELRIADLPFKKKRAAIYARYSSQHQTELSVEGQTERILEYCKKNGFEIVKEYADRGVSAFLIEKRLDFQKLIQDALESKFDYVIVWSTADLPARA